MNQTLRKTALFLLCLLIVSSLSSCRVRTSLSPQDEALQTLTAPEGSSGAGEDSSGSAVDPDKMDAAGMFEVSEPGGQTRENPDALRKEYDENAAAEIIEGTERMLHGEGEGSGAFTESVDGGQTVRKVNADADETARMETAVDEADNTGVSEDGAEADSFLEYYSVLLQDRMQPLFECKRQYVYWETIQDHVTIFKTSSEHQLILDAGAYDVSARLLEENLTVDDSWVVRKNPGVIVKVVGSDTLGSTVRSAEAAELFRQTLVGRAGWSGIDAVRLNRVLLLSEEMLDSPSLRLAAMLALAKTAVPEQFPDVDVHQALEALFEEANGEKTDGIYYYVYDGGSGL